MRCGQGLLTYQRPWGGGVEGKSESAARAVDDPGLWAGALLVRVAWCATAALVLPSC